MAQPRRQRGQSSELSEGCSRRKREARWHCGEEGGDDVRLRVTVSNGGVYCIV